MSIVFFIQYLSIKCDDVVYYDLIQYPILYHYDEHDNFVECFNNEISLLEDYISKEKIIEQVKYNVQNTQLSKTIIGRHLTYCKENKISEAIPLATTVCIGMFSDYLKNLAYHYLLVMVNHDYIYQEILPFADDVLLVEIAQSFTRFNSIQIINKLLERTKELGEPKAFLRQLIMLQSKEGLQLYHQICLETNTIPDYSGENSNMINRITETIQEINKPELLPELSKLTHLLFQDDFKDGHIDNLYSGLTKSFIEIGEEYFDDVNSILITLMSEDPNNLELQSFCNHIIDTLRQQRAIANVEIMSIKQIKQLFN